MAYTLISIINILERVITLLLFAHIILSYVMSPFHPLRQTIDKVVSPMLDPIRRMLPTTGGMDFSAMALWLIVYLVARILRELILTIY